jgi:hypothetical protein
MDAAGGALDARSRHVPTPGPVDSGAAADDVRGVLAAPRLLYPDDLAVTCDGIDVRFERTGGRVEVACAGTTLSLRPGASAR